MDELFPNNPLVEVVFQVRFDGELSIDSRKHEFFDAVRKDFPKLQVASDLAATPHLLIPIRLTDVNEEKLIQFSITTFSYHHKKYPGFEAFKKEALKYNQKFCEMFAIKKLGQTGLRYINHIPIVREKGTVPLERLINFGYKLPSAVPSKLESFQTSFETIVGKSSIKVQIMTARNQSNQEVLVLDFDFLTKGELETADLPQYLEDSHRETKGIFNGFITEEYKTIMRQKLS